MSVIKDICGLFITRTPTPSEFYREKPREIRGNTSTSEPSPTSDKNRSNQI